MNHEVFKSDNISPVGIKNPINGHDSTLRQFKYAIIHRLIKDIQLGFSFINITRRIFLELNYINKQLSSTINQSSTIIKVISLRVVVWQCLATTSDGPCNTVFVTAIKFYVAQ